jgi:hypothetical protein
MNSMTTLLTARFLQVVSSAHVGWEVGPGNKSAHVGWAGKGRQVVSSAHVGWAGKGRQVVSSAHVGWTRGGAPGS